MPFTIEIALSGKKNVQSHLVRWVQLTGTTTSDRTGFYKQSKKWFAYVRIQYLPNSIPLEFHEIYFTGFTGIKIEIPTF